MIKQNIIIQPIGNNEIDTFLNDSQERWAEKDKYREQWKNSKGCIVLFVKNGNIFAKGTITKIDESDDAKYPLNYYYNLEELDKIDYGKIISFTPFNVSHFRNYTFLDDDSSEEIIKYLDSILEVYVNDNEADSELQSTIQNIYSSVTENKPQPSKPSKIVNGNNIFPRKQSYAKEALERAKYLCEFNKSHETFISKFSKKQYVEAHHLIPLANSGVFSFSLDVPANIISLCPTCHRQVHYGNADEILEVLFSIHNDALKQCGLEVIIEDLKAIYKNPMAR